MPAYYSWQGEDLILHCHLQPKASSDEVVGVHGDRLKLRITAPPVAGKANEHLIKWFSKLFKAPKSDIEILQGELGRQKTLRIRSPKVLPEYILRAADVACSKTQQGAGCMVKLKSNLKPGFFFTGDF